MRRARLPPLPPPPLQECEGLTGSTKWSKALDLIEMDPRFSAVESGREREELYDDFLADLRKKEAEKKREARKGNLEAFRKLLEDQDFIDVKSQWRKVRARWGLMDREDMGQGCGRGPSWGSTSRAPGRGLAAVEALVAAF